MKKEILKQLRESSAYISGQRLCDTYSVSRTAIWKVIEQLKKEGYEIEAVRNKGYRLIESPDVITEAELESLMETTWAGKQVAYMEETDSTNTQAKALGEKGAVHGTLVVADRQNAGKGRRGRTWTSPQGTSIYMSILLRPEIVPAKAPMLTLVMALSAVEGIAKVLEVEAGIKWPNDVVANGKKICGILTEMSTEIDFINYVVVGIGVNSNEENFPDELKEKATSLRLICGHPVKRSALIAGIMKQFERNYNQFVKDGNLCNMKNAYNRVLVNCKKQVRVLEPGHEYEAFAEGITDTGELIVRKDDGEECNIFAGEVSVRGVYGYV